MWLRLRRFTRATITTPQKRALQRQRSHMSIASRGIMCRTVKEMIIRVLSIASVKMQIICFQNAEFILKIGTSCSTYEFQLSKKAQTNLYFYCFYFIQTFYTLPNCFCHQACDVYTTNNVRPSSIVLLAAAHGTDQMRL